MTRDADQRGPGGAITVAVCGSLDHPPPCPLAPHHTAVHRDGGMLTVRTLFAAMPEDEMRIRGLIIGALAKGGTATPDGTTVRWVLREQQPVRLRPDEADHVGRLIASATQDSGPT
jgi:hypothetical protein